MESAGFFTALFFKSIGDCYFLGADRHQYCQLDSYHLYAFPRTFIIFTLSTSIQFFVRLLQLDIVATMN